MKGDAKPLVKFLEGADNRFIIPVYQRNYDWKQDNCKQLFNDLIKVIKDERESHFFGSIVSSLYEGRGSSEYLIIDGQQRITTISLLLLAVVNLTKEEIIQFENSRLLDKIWKTYLIDEYSEENKVRLKHVKHDYEAFEKLLFGRKEDYDLTSNVTQNYLYFYNRIKEKNELTSDEIYLAITRLVIIDIFLHKEDNAQLIFESLNSTGLELEEGDKIRNFVLMSLEPKKQEDFYKKYWHKIEENTDYEVSIFVRDYLTLKQNRISSFKNIYTDFKEYVEINNLVIEHVLKDLLEYSAIYKSIINNSIGNTKVNTVLARINQLEMSVTYPFLLSLFQYSKSNSLDDNEIKSILEVIEIYLFRRFITGIPTNALNKIFMTLHKDILKLKEENDSYNEVLTYVLISKTGSGQFPNDDDFIRLFSTKNLYHIIPKNREYLFERLESGNNLESVNIIGRMRRGVYSVEHIMPQVITTQWRSELGGNADEVHQKWLHRIANLTLTAYNSRYSNRSFVEKRDLSEVGFRESGIKLNQYIASFNNWTEKELEERQSYLNNKALKLWPFPKTTFLPLEKPADIHGLDEDFDFTGYYIKSYSFDETTQTVGSWREMYVSVIELIYEKSLAIINRLADKADFLSIVRTPNNGYVQIAESIYLYKDNSTMSKINILKKIFDECNIDKELLQFEIYLQNIGSEIE
ncbi:MAG: DUF262 domain-containing protein [Prevotella sp.]|jgi:uncharacterized protein with ParB-like and HNH nuclease domain|nr:DUF262 domain-containing protein [Prevotella sp.]